jgi:alpha-L-fucosidase 2
MRKNEMKMNYPASWWGAMWREALPSGNGEIGAAVYGGVYEETIMLTHADLWWKSYTPPMPDVSYMLPEARRLLMENKPQEAERILPDELIKNGYAPKMAGPLPLGDFKIIMPSKNAFKKYSRDLNMETGEITVSWMDGSVNYKRSFFVSRPDNVVVGKISSNGEENIDAKLYIDLHDRKDAAQYADNATIKYTENVEEYLPQNLEVKSEDGFLYYAAQNDDGTDFGAVVRVVAAKISSVQDYIKVDDQEILVIIKPFVKGDRKKEWIRLSEELSRIEDSYESLLQRHANVHEKLLNAATLDLFGQGYNRSNEALLMEAYSGDTPMALIEKMWAYGRYLLISSSKENGHPCHLYGLWCGEYQGMWAFNMLNENIQMIYWHALSGNMPELLLAVFDYYERMMDDLKENAKNLYGCRGIYIPAPTTPESGLLKLVLPHILHWTGGAGWLAQHYYDYYLYTGDVDFLEKRALPFMVEAALFYEDFFTVGENGYYISCPSNSPENTPGNYWRGKGMNGGGGNMETTINATMDFAIAKELLTHLVEGAEIANCYQDKIEKWQEILSRIPAYEINEDGAVKEWMHEYFTDNYHHRHESHLYPVFPGIEVTRENNPQLFEGFVEAVKKRLVVGLKEQSGWSLAHMANNYARMGEGNLALECLEIMSRSCVLNNLYTTHNDWRGMGVGVDMFWAPIQVDANMGWCSAINEMLLFSVPGKISILPALPDKWSKGKVERLLARGGIEVSIEWDQDAKTIQVTLLSLNKDCTIEMIIPDIVDYVEQYSIDSGKVKNICLVAQETLVLDMRINK